ncbi:hypothetical protein WME91_49355 [Sorangium sp. So ce269]
MLATLREMAMDPDKIPETAASRRFRLFFEKRGRIEGKVEGKVEGKQEALLAVLTARGLPPTDQERLQIASCTSGAELDRWIARAATAASTGGVFAPAPSRPARRSPAATRSRTSDREPRTRKSTRPQKTAR